MDATEIGKTLGYTYRVLSMGIEIGQAGQPLFPIKWEEGLERPLAQWREELNIDPVTEGVFSWYSRPNPRGRGGRGRCHDDPGRLDND